MLRLSLVIFFRLPGLIEVVFCKMIYFPPVLGIIVMCSSAFLL